MASDPRRTKRSEKGLLTPDNCAPIRDEYELRTNVRFSISRQPLACDLDLFHSTDVGHVLRGQGISASSRRHCSVLR
jgi:hypothetical protein